MAYAAVISLKQTIKRLLNSPHISIVPHSPEILESAYKEVQSLQEVLERLDSSSSSSGRVTALDGQIREGVCELEDVIESHVLNQFLSQSEIPADESHPLLFSIDLQDLKQEIHSFAETVKKMEEEYIKELDSLLSKEDDDAVSSRIDFGGKKSKMVGLSDEVRKIKDLLMGSSSKLEIVSLVGIEGIGKTTVANEILEDPFILSHFDCGAWVTIGPKYQLKEILLCILVQANPGNYKMLLKEEDKELAEYLYKSLKGKRYLIVLDDIWETLVFDYLKRSFPEDNMGSRVLLTTRLQQVAYSVSHSWLIHEMRLLNKEESWYILCEKVFAEELCPPQLEKAGKKIAENCEGLPLAIITVADILSKSEKITENWNKVAEKGNSIFMEAYNQISKINNAEDLQLSTSVPDGNDDDAVSSRISFGGMTSKIVGLSDAVGEIKDLLMDWSSKLEIVSLVGIAGIGKTAVANEIIEDPFILSHFDIYAWLTIGQKYQLKEILQHILVQVNPGNYETLLLGGDMKLAKYLFKSLKGRRYLIVLDDIWDTQVLDYLRRSFPNESMGSRVLLTTRLHEVADSASHSGPIHQMQLLNKEESWYLLCEKVFSEELCPPQLEETGRKIAENCGGIPLSIITVSGLLSEYEKTTELWSKVAEKRNSISMESYLQMSKRDNVEDRQLSTSVPDDGDDGDDDDDDAISSRIGFGGKMSKMVGLFDEVGKIKDLLMGWSSELEIITLVGISGIGKTTVANEVVEDPDILSHFDKCVWLTIGPKYQLKEILKCILVQVNPRNYKTLCMDGDMKLAEYLYKSLEGRRYLIVLDDIWDKLVLDYLKRSFPDDSVGSRILLTTRLQEVAYSVSHCGLIHQMRLLNIEESWYMLCEKVFAQELCPPQLEKAGKKIAENCEGLPLTIIMVADLLSKSEKTIEYWNKVAEKGNSIFMEAYNQISKMDHAEDLQLSTSVPDDDDGGNAVSSRIGFRGKKSKMVRLSDEVGKTKDLLMGSSSKLEIISLGGLAGSGKTTVANEILEDPFILSHFDCNAWVTIGPKYQLKEILKCILVQVNPCSYKMLLMEGDMELAEYLYNSLMGRRYLIVLDDIRDTLVMDYLRRFFPDDNMGSRVLMTTRLLEVAYYISCSGLIRHMHILNNEESWHLLCEKVFGKELCPPQLEEAGKRIAENCEGLPLSIITVAGLLSKYEKTTEYWYKVAEKGNSISMESYLQMSKIYKIAEDLKLSTSFPDDGGDDAVSLRIEYDGKKSGMVGLSDELCKIKDQLTDWYDGLKVVSLVGMAGIGKTTLTKEVFEDPSILLRFDCRVWVTIGQKYQLKEIMRGILAQVNPGIDIDKMLWQSHEILALHLYKSLMDKRYLIVFDDVWNTNVLYHLERSLPNNYKGSRVLLTTRQEKIAMFPYDSRVHQMRFLDKEESWYLLREKVFPKGSCPSQLVEAGKEIAKNCDGLPLAIITVADLLFKAEKTPEYWKEVAEKKNSVFMDAYDQMSKVLLPSYNFLPQHLKACFLYMGIFPENYEIPSSKLIKLWSAEGFLEPNPSQTVEDFAVECLQELVSNNLVIIRQQSSSRIIKTCSLHSVFLHLSIIEAGKNKVFHVLKYSDADGLVESMKSERRLSVQNSILFGIKDVYNSMASIPTVRSLLCTGPRHQYPVPICFTLRLLKILDALAIRFYQFPIEVLKLVHLRHLAITCNGKLPPSISKLWNLQCLIVHRHLSIKSSEDLSYLPIEIWKMQELKHLQITGSNLPDPCGAQLPNLSTLLDVSAHSCTKSVLEGIPNLQKLGIRIELAPDAAEPLLCCFDHISLLHGLESLKCVIVNPELRFEVVTLPASLPIFPSSLKKLSLSGLRYPWKYMRMIASLPNLEVLKLRSYAFRGPVWQIYPGEFLGLKFLLLEDTDLVHWRGNPWSLLPSLRCLIIRHCYKLMEIPLNAENKTSMVELFDCNPSASKQIQDDQIKRGNCVSVHSSLEVVVKHKF